MNLNCNLITCCVKYKDKLAIGYKDTNDLIFKNKKDLEFFKNTTKNCIIVMGMNTWKSIGSKPLSYRYNIIITTSGIIKTSQELSMEHPLFLTMKGFIDYFSNNTISIPIFIIGGESIYKYALDNFNVNSIYITLVENFKHIKEPTVFFPDIPHYYQLNSNYSKKEILNNEINFRFLLYNKTNSNSLTVDHLYKNLVYKIITDGYNKDDRTNTGTVCLFGESLKIDVSKYAPLLTTKYMNWKHIIEELLWFLRGDTDSKILNDKGIKIWNGNTSREFLDKQGLNNYPEGCIGASYSWQWRNFGAEYNPIYKNTKINKCNEGFDQIKYILDLLKNDRNSRRIVLSGWNPAFLDKMALPPCHLMAIFNVKNNTYLNCHLIMRSSDVGLGLPYNLFSYTVLLYILAIKSDLLPGELYYTGTDVHIYKDHTEKLKEQLNREIKTQPILYINPDVKNKDISDISIDDFDVIGYYPGKMLKMNMAV